jgi:hypothetical protein
MTYFLPLAHELRLRYGLSIDEPTDVQLLAIVRELQEIRARNSDVAESEWRAAVVRHCPSVDSMFYKGMSNEDLNTLLGLAIQALQR